ncbi:MAG: tRNA (adenosine(37)-N6)-dimethylallyltransferase MiaA [Dehalococcoidia bacterium]
MLRRLVAIVGATGTGKSAIALELTQRLGGEIVNADSRQVYRGMDIGTAKPTVEDRKKARHHLYDVADPADGYNLALYQKQARETLDAIWDRSSFAWLVGGTGQYVWGLLEAWQVPDVAPDEGLRAELAAFAEANGAVALHQRLAAIDPPTAERIDARNIRRVIRAIEVYERSGRTMSDWQAKCDPDFEFLLFGIDMPRKQLYERVDRRVEAMFDSGLLEEVQSLLDAGVPADAPAMSSIGYGESVNFLRGQVSLEEAKERTKVATHRLIRSQDQWFRRDDKRITWVHDADDIDMQANIFTGACTNVIRGENRR